MSILVESTIEQAAIEWFQQLGYHYIHGGDIERPLKEVILKDQLHQFLSKQYPDLPKTVLDEAQSIIISNKGMDLDYRNRDFHLKLSKGIDISWKDKTGKEQARHLYAINFEHPENNTFLCVNQLTVEGKNTRSANITQSDHLKSV